MKRQKLRVECRELVAEGRLEIGESTLRFIPNQRLLCRQPLEVGHVFVGVLFVEKVGQCPRLGIRVGRLVRIGEAIGLRDQRRERIAARPAAAKS